MSADIFLGIPFNIASYALLTHMLAQICGLKVSKFIHVVGDAHIYNNHIEQCKEMISREDLELPELVMPEFKTLDELLLTKTSDYILNNYISHDAIKGEMAV